MLNIWMKVVSGLMYKSGLFIFVFVLSVFEVKVLSCTAARVCGIQLDSSIGPTFAVTR